MKGLFKSPSLSCLLLLASAGLVFESEFLYHFALETISHLRDDASGHKEIQAETQKLKERRKYLEEAITLTQSEVRHSLSPAVSCRLFCLTAPALSLFFLS